MGIFWFIAVNSLPDNILADILHAKTDDTACSKLLLEMVSNETYAMYFY